MILKKLHFPIYIMLLMLLFFSQSCEKKKQKNPKKKSDVKEINRFLAIGHKHFENEEEIEVAEVVVAEAVVVDQEEEEH